VAIKPSPGVDALYAPRRTVLDPVLVDAAAAAGAEVRYGVSVTGLLRDGSGSVVGVRGRDRDGSTLTVHAGLTVGADGIRSTVAAEVGAATLRTGDSAGAVVYGYWSELPVEGYEWFYRPGHSAGLIPTNGGEVCVFAGVPAHNLGRDYFGMLAAATGGADGRLEKARPPRRLRTLVGRRSFVRQAYGPGWALVGDAGSFLDPLSTHGITDALRDAEMLARAEDDLDRYAAERDRVVLPMHEVADRIAGYAWDIGELQRDLRALSATMTVELELIQSADSARAASRLASNVAYD
jgi:flavin-dependent dehydrogenase